MKAQLAEGSLLERTRSDVNSYLADYFANQMATSNRISLQYGRLWKVMSGLNQSGGKRLRPYMVMLAYECYGGKDKASMLPIAASWELLHLCMLIHDDIIDNDLVRYGVKNVAGTYRDVYEASTADTGRQQHLADGAALLAGDLALSAAHELVITSSLTPELKLLAQRHLLQATYTVAAGELLDSEAALYPIMEADPLLTARLKTASYSFVGPLTTGAALAGASRAELAAVQEFGEALGTAYQLLDDLIGAFGDPAVTGKSATGDLSEGKRTLLLQETFRRSNSQDSQCLHRLIGKADLSTQEADVVRSIIISCGARRHVEVMIETYTGRARQVADSLAIPAACKPHLYQLIDATSRRKY